MNIKTTFLLLFFMMVFLPTLSSAENSYRSKYTGEEKREIKSLSAADIEELSAGKGWGLAKAAELNGVPGPVHLLEMKVEIALSAKQVRAIEDIYKKMQQEAIPLGLELIAFEKELNTHFAKRTITYELLGVLLERGAQIRKKLRYAHLSAHLKTPKILTPKQIALYNKLRGYSSEDPCKKIPKGHDPVMWKKHNNCP